MSIQSDQTCANGHCVPALANYCPECGAARASTTPEPTSDLASGPSMDAAPPDPSTALLSELGGAVKRPRRTRRFVLFALVVLLLAASAGFGTWFFALRTTDDDRYVAGLAHEHLFASFGSREAAISQGKAFCASLEAGHKPRGYRSQAIAVEYFCPDYAKGFAVVPTPQELRASLTAKLRDQGLGGKFASDAAAVAHAKSVCSSLTAGGAQQGPEVDAVSVSVYCPKYQSGFKTLYPIHVKGTFELDDTSASVYYQSISGSNGDCSGDSGYSDISQGTEVVIKNNAGTVLTTTNLGRGHGFPPISCTFPFSFTVMDGATGGYSITVADRGEIHYTAAQLKLPGSVALSLGD